jgi:endonuclease/exonuclease/phosphatase family metal-dependent hydrolase
MVGASSSALSPSRTKARRWLRTVAIGLAVAYPAVLLLTVLLLRFEGEEWWATALGLYLPRWIFAAPLPFAVAALFAYKERKLLVTQAVAVVLLAFPLMGFVLPWFSGKSADEPVVRVLSYNVNSGHGGYDKVAEEIEGYSPDIVFLQECAFGIERIAELLKVRYDNVLVSSQFLLATRYPVVSSFDPEKLPHEGRLRSPRFVQYLVETPIGRIAFYNVHPVSPRFGLYRIRGAGLRREILSGRLFAGENTNTLLSDSALRGEQVEAFSRYAEQEHDPVVIAGDTNLPGLSVYLHRHLSRYQDGFNAAGWGFGYTFPADKTPWMRIDRILASDQLRFVDFQVCRSRVSDHLCVVADIQKKKP